MAYTMTHILIAEKVLEYIDVSVNYSSYIVGAVAPDAVHASSQYTPALKERSHLFVDGAVWGRVTREKEFCDWLENIKKFYLLNFEKYNRDFLLGYIVHILTDVCSCKRMFLPFYTSLSEDIYEDKMYQFKEESYSVNYHLFIEYSLNKNLAHILQEGKTCSLTDVFDDRLMIDRTHQLFDFEFAPHDISNIDSNEICTIQNTRELILSVPEMIKQIFLDDYYVKIP